MENETNQPALCRNGCGFYGNPSTEGMCSKCFKDSVRRKQSSPTASPASTSTSSLTSTCNITGSSSSGNVHVDGAMAAAAASISSLPTALPSNDNNTTQDRQPSLEPEAAGTSDDDKDKSKKRNRCFSCRKKVGLTGFECRCGNVFCGLHRYSDKHNCTFDYKAEGRAKITKDNPVILAEKIQKI